MVLSLLLRKCDNRAHPHALFFLSLAPSQGEKQDHLEFFGAAVHIHVSWFAVNHTPYPMNIVLDVVFMCVDADFVNLADAASIHSAFPPQCNATPLRTQHRIVNQVREAYGSP